MTRFLNSSLSYLGVESKNPPNFTTQQRAPLTTDFKMFDLGDIWLQDKTVNIWMLTDKKLNIATWTDISSAGSDIFKSIIVDPGDVTLNVGNINVALGNVTISAGNLALPSIYYASTLRTNATGVVSGLVDPGVPTAGEGTVYHSNDTGVVKWGKVVSAGATVIITTSAGGINIEAVSGTTGSTFTADDGEGSAPTVGGEVTLSGGVNLVTTAATDNTVTFNLDTSIVLSDTSTDGSEGLYSLSGNDFLHNYGIKNSFLGESAGNRTLTALSATNNTAVGSKSYQPLTTGACNSFLGSYSGKDNTTGNFNSGFGYKSLNSLTTSSYNTGVGSESFSEITTGGFNIGLGYKAGNSCITSDSSNIFIGNIGSTGTSNTVRIGSQGTGDGEQDTCYIAGIYGSTVGATKGIVKVDSDGKLGMMPSGANGEILIGKTGGESSWQSITAGSKIDVTPGENSITISDSSETNYIMWGIASTWVSDATIGWNDIAYDGTDIFVVVSNYGHLSYSLDDGATWSTSTTRLVSGNAVVFGDGMWASVGDDGRLGYKTTLDPSGTWQTTRPFTTEFGNPLTMYTVEYGDGYWVAGAKNCYVAYTTSLSGTWTIVRPTYIGPDIHKIHYADGLWVAVGANGSVHVATSPSGTWTLNTVSTYSGAFLSVTYADGYWVAVGEAGAIYITTNPSGVWSSVYDDTGTDITDIHYGNGTWCATLRYGSTLITNGDPTGGWIFGITAPDSFSVFVTNIDYATVNCVYKGNTYWILAGRGEFISKGTQI